jgi:hypothetical protein
MVRDSIRAGPVTEGESVNLDFLATILIPLNVASLVENLCDVPGSHGRV